VFRNDELVLGLGPRNSAVVLPQVIVVSMATLPRASTRHATADHRPLVAAVLPDQSAQFLVFFFGETMPIGFRIVREVGGHLSIEEQRFQTIERFVMANGSCIWRREKKELIFCLFGNGEVEGKWRK
jgi:hypothetical protein